MQVGADVHSCGYFARTTAESKARWPVGEASSTPSITDLQRQRNYLGNWGDEDEYKAGDTGTDKECGSSETLGPSSTSPTFSKATIGQLTTDLQEGACPFNTRPELCTVRKTESKGRGECRVRKVVPPVTLGAAPHQRPTSLCRSLSVSEQEAKDARIQSQKIAAQLTTPPSANSKGVLLFQKRKKRVNEFTLTSYGKQEPWSGSEVSRPVDGDGRAPRDRLDATPAEKARGSANSSSSSEGSSIPYFERRVKGDSMDASTVGNHEFAGVLEGRTEEVEDCASEDEGEEQYGEGAVGELGGATEAAGEQDVVQSVMNSTVEYPLKTNNLVKPARTTMEVRLVSSQQQHEPDDKVYMDLPGELNSQTDGDKIQESQEVYVPEGKQAPVANRTPKPFLSEGVSPKPYKPQVGAPVGSPFSPVYSNPPPVSQMRSPPPSASSGPSAVAQAAKPPAVWANKTGILEESRMRRAGRKPMFTFHEKPKVTPNPELLSLVQGIDVKKKGEAEPLTEEDCLGLGAEASTFAQQKSPPPVAPKPVVSSQDGTPIPEWASCLKPPELRAPRRLGATQTLTEVKGKGAELFARRQSRMERYTFESSPAKDSQPRPPSPTMSLPPSWKCRDERHSPSPFNHKSLHLGSRPPTSAFAQVNKVNSSPQALADPARHQPHQLNSSLFIISPDKSPLTSLPRGAPSPPRLIFPGTTSYVRQTSAPPSSYPPPPTAAKPPAVPPPLSRVNGFTNHSPSVDLREPAFQPAQASPSSSPSPRPKEVTQAPRPSFSARRAGLQPQGQTSPATSPWKPNFDRRLSNPRLYTDTFRTQPISECRPGSPKSPFYPISPPATDNWSPPREPKPSSPARPGGDSTDGRRLKDLLAKNVVNAARRKKLSSPITSPTIPGDLALPLSPQTSCLSPPFPLSSSVASPEPPTRSVRSPLKLYRRSLTDSEFSLGSDDSGLRSPSYYNFCPRGWSGSKLRQSDQL